MLRPALAALLLAAPLAVAHPAAASAIDLGKVMPLGDSITEGFPNNGNGGYRLPLQQRLVDAGYTYDFVGTRTSNAPNPSPFPEFDPHHAGYAGYQVLNNNNPGGGDLAGFQPDERSLAQQQLDANPDLVLLHAGINDTFQGDAQLQIADDLNTLVDQIYAAAPATRVVLASTIGRANTDTSILNRATQHRARQLAAQGTDIAYAGLMAKRITPDYLFDSVHPDPAGYDAMAQVWFDALTTPDTPAPRAFDFATTRSFPDHFYIPTGDPLTTRDNLPGLDATPGILAFEPAGPNDTARALWNPHTTESNFLADTRITADVAATQNNTTLSLIGRVGLDATGTVDLGGYGLCLTLNDAAHSPDRLALTDLAGSELAALDLDADLTLDTWYTLALTIFNADVGVVLLATLHDAAQPNAAPLAALAHIDAAHTHAAPGQFGLALDAGPNAAHWHLDRLTLTDATRHGLPDLHMFEGNALPEPATAVIALGFAAAALRRTRG
ncbi:MAG: GDSL-type esterase/lipase family protein [Planctomycetota bacterium]